jgi:hypothetical protein
MYEYTYYSRFIPEGVGEESQTLLRVAHVLHNYFAMSNTAGVTGGKTRRYQTRRLVCMYELFILYFASFPKSHQQHTRVHTLDFVPLLFLGH